MPRFLLPLLAPASRQRAILLRFLLPLLLLAYFGTLLFAACHFPEPYDWRYRVISNLLSPRDNPQFYRLPSIGLAVAGILMIPVAGYLADRLEPFSRRWAHTAWWCFFAGSGLLVLAALVVPQHVHPVLGFRRLHEALARSSALAIGGGMAACIVGAWTHRRRTGLPRLDRRLMVLWALLTFAPIAGIALSQALLFLSRHSQRWGPSIRAAMRHSVFWHLGFWEWTGSVAVFLYFAAGVLLLPEAPEPPRSNAG